MPRKAKKLCTTQECGRTDVVALGLCTACYARAHYWNRRSLKDKSNHMRKLRVRENAMQDMLGNVTPIARAKRRAAK